MPQRAMTLSSMKRQTSAPRPDNRPSAAKRGYDYKWTKLRNWYAKNHPLCCECLKIGITTAWSTIVRNGKIKRVSNEVDHIIPHKGDNALRLSISNLQTLCKSHHSNKTASEDGGFGHKIKENI